jgi:hypothetical protein
VKKLSMLGIIGGVALLTAAPFSLQWSQKNVLLSLDSADARIGRPLTPLSVAGAPRRAYRRAYRSAFYGSALAGAAYGYWRYYGYGYPAYSSYYAPQSYSYYAPQSYNSYYAPQSYSYYAAQSYSSYYAGYYAEQHSYLRPYYGYYTGWPYY